MTTSATTTTQTRTRFAPSPTGFLHLGNIRSALYPWAFARATGGVFVLRIEDTDVERSSQAAVDVIIEGMRWLGLDHDEGPFFQMQRMARYKEVLAELQSSSHVYPCYMSMTELDALRQAQTQAKQKPRYDGTWRPEPGKTLPAIPHGVQPVLRFKNPQGGSVVWEDKVKGRIEISNDELDDLVIARPDGTPTYNFCVVVDDIDMAITHVIRGDDHVNNTPRQINIFQALGRQVPVYAHLPTVMAESVDAHGEKHIGKMSKRSGAKAVTQFAAEGFLPDAVINYLARLGWSHGDDEIFSRQQFVSWFNLDHLGKSAAQFDEAKLRWVNAQHLKALADGELAELVRPFLLPEVATALDAAILVCACGVFKDRCATLVELAAWIKVLVQPRQASAEDLAAHVNPAARVALDQLAKGLASCDWNKPAISAAIKQVLLDTGLKMPQLAMPLRVLLLGTPQTPPVDAVLELMARSDVVERLRS